MPIDLPALDEREQSALISICIQAAHADGSLSELEQSELKRIIGKLSQEGFDLAAAETEALRQSSPAAFTSLLTSRESKSLAYEMAVCICNAGEPAAAAERAFLERLRAALQLEPGEYASYQADAALLGSSPLESPPMIAQVPAEVKEVDALILNRSILAGGLELMPQSLATMAILPVQLQLVYRIGKTYGHELSLGHAKEFLATIGVGFTAQVVESYLTRMVRSVTKRFAGRVVAALASQATESAIAFATTYAIGQTAQSYYKSGRALSAGQLREVFTKMLDRGRSMKSQYAGDISKRASSIRITDLLPGR